MALADQALPTQEAFILRPAISGLTRTIMLLSLPVAIWSLLFVARVPTRGPRYPKLGLWAILLRRRGRIGRQQFWAGLLVNLLISGMIFGLFAVLGQQMSVLAALGPLVALTVFIGLQSLISRKRLHDLGVSAWTMVWPWLISLGLIVVAGGIAMLQMQAIEAQMAGCGGPVPMASYIAGGAAGFCVVAIHIGFLLWLGLSGPNCEDETYGPIPAIEAEVC